MMLDLGDAHRDTLDRPHPDDECVQCESCGHWACDHYAYDHPGENGDDCQRAGCECPMTLVDNEPVQMVVAIEAAS